MADLLERLRHALASRYRIERLLGSGGMADVYLAQDLKHPRRVAIKVLKPELAAVLGRERFLREIELAATLQHPFILGLLDSGAAGELLYYVMPYLEGDTLRQRLEREKQLPLEDALRITAEVAEALDHAHRQGVVHRDIKPENLLFEGGHALVADFGIARAVGLAGGTRLTETGVTLGTSAYLSPEQALGGRELDGRSDQYSLACVAYEMLAGQPPFTGATAESVVHQHVAASPRSVTDLRSGAPAGVAAALSRALAKAPADRFASAGEFAGAMKAGQAQPATGESAVAGRIPAKRGRLPALAAVGLIAAAAAFSWWWFEFRGRAAIADPLHKDLILVAQFEGPADDPELAASFRTMLTAALDQSGVAATVADADVRGALRSAGRPDTTRVDAALARELAYRRAIRAVLEGQVSRLGTGYSLTTRLVDVENGRTLLTASETSPDQARLVPTVERLGHRLRSGLGEQRAALRASRALVDVATPDFEAYRLVIRGREAGRRGDPVHAIHLYRAAIARDPQFASAWRLLGVALWNKGSRDSSRWANEEALRHSGRLSEWERLQVEAQLAFFRRDLPSQLEALNRALEACATPDQLATTHGSRAAALGYTNQFEEAFESTRLAEKNAVFEASETMLGNQILSLARLKEFDEAWKVLERMREREEVAARLHLFSERWAEAESIAISVLSRPGSPVSRRISCAAWAASGSAARGRLARARHSLGVGRRIAEEAKNPWAALLTGLEAELVLYAGHGAVPSPPPASTDTSFDGALLRASWRVLRGQDAETTVERLLADPRSRHPEYDVRVAVIRGGSALAQGRTSDGMALLGPVARETGGPYYTWFENLNARQHARWLTASSYMQRGSHDSAAVCLELLLAPVGKYRDLIPWRGFHTSFAHQRLVLLYARMGRLEDARRHWEAFAKAFDDPDPELRPLVAEARDALASAEAMTKSTSR